MNDFSVIPGFDGAYRISRSGRVQSCYVPGTRGKRGPWWDMKQQFDANGYPLTYLWNRATKRPVRRLVHQLVAEAFIPRPVGVDSINHMNGVKVDNRVANLEWCTRAENMRHAWRTGLCTPHKLTAEKVREIRAGTLNDTQTAKIYGVSQVMVTRIRAGKVWRHA